VVQEAVWLWLTADGNFHNAMEMHCGQSQLRTCDQKISQASAENAQFY
jgi:chorismate-pyruvate lyase